MENQFEIWKDVLGYEEIYLVSSFGRVKSKPKKRLNYDRFLKPGKNSDGYFSVVLYKKDIKKSFKAHRLVANSFIENLNNLEMVNHIDENKQNNKIENLEWVSRIENGVHRYKNKDTTSKYCGVSWSKQNKKWMATIRFNNKQIYLGCFDCELTAYQKRIDFERNNGISNKYL
jgi:NUMOD4 motif/HNH endonuclease